MVQVFSFALVILILTVLDNSAASTCNKHNVGQRMDLPMSCSRFLECSNDRYVVVRECPNGLHFNRELQMCDLPTRAGCEYQGIMSVDSQCSSCDCDICCSPQADTTTQAPCEETTTPEITTTPCEETTTPETPCGGVTQTETVPTPTDDTQTVTSTIPTPSDCEGVCCGKNDGEKLAGEKCQQFIVCTNDNPITFDCPNNLYYNPTTGACDFPENVECDKPYETPNSGPSGTQCANGGRCIGSPDGTFFPDANNQCSSSYVICQCECEVTRSCSGSLMFNSLINVCDWPTSFGC